jgi:hypothetical protein
MVNLEFEIVYINGKKALYTIERLIRKSFSDNSLNIYDLRGRDDDPGRICTIERNVGVNHCGSIISEHIFNTPSYPIIDFTGECVIIKNTIDDIENGNVIEQIKSALSNSSVVVNKSECV